MNAILVRINMVFVSVLLLTILSISAAGQTAASQATSQADDQATQPTIRAVLQSAKDRKSAPNFILKDASGKTVRLQDYRGKVLLLDFWATWCHGCKEEIPWFSEFEKTYGKRGFAVVGVSMDYTEGGWNIVKPFLADSKVPYTMVLGDDPTTQKYGIESMPDTFLIDRQGRIAAAYTTGLVDKDDVEANIRAMLSKR